MLFCDNGHVQQDRVGRYCSVCGTPLTRPKLVKIFEYLYELNQANSPVEREIDKQGWVMWLNKEKQPNHPYFTYGLAQEIANDTTIPDTAHSLTIPDTAHSLTIPDTAHSFTVAQTVSCRNDEHVILKVSRPELPDPPKPPKEIIAWLSPGWHRPDVEIHVETTIKGESFDDDPSRQQCLDDWKKRREVWREQEYQASEVITIYNALSRLRAMIERDAERWELLLGNGLLTWHEKSIHHPLLLLRLRLEEDKQAEILTLKLVEAGEAPTLYEEVFNNIPDIDRKALEEARHDLYDRVGYPLDVQETINFLIRLTGRISPKARFVKDPTLPKDKSTPYIEDIPVVFLRKRTTGFSAVLESIRKDLTTTRGRISRALSCIMGIDPLPEDRENTEPQGLFARSEYDHFFLTKPINEEQLKILERLVRQDAVLVQGPPGTGKTHTIANLLGHFLAEGKKVLVTSSTAKSLKALREKVAFPLQPLCVSLLEDNSRLVEDSIKTIIEHQEADEVATLKRKIEEEERKRANLVHQLREVCIQLEEALSEEYRAIPLAGEKCSPAQVARYLADKKIWIPKLQRPVKLGEPLPLPIEELAELYQSNVTITAQDEQEMALLLPDPNNLISSENFVRLVAEYNQLSRQPDETRSYGSDLWRAAWGNQVSLELGELRKRIQELPMFPDSAQWQLAAIQAGMDRNTRQAWEEIVKWITEIKQLANQAEPLLQRYNPSLPEDCLPGRLKKVLNEIEAYIRDGGDLNGFRLFLHRGWQVFLTHARVNEEPLNRLLPSHQLEALKAIDLMIELKRYRKNLIIRWTNEITALGGTNVTTQRKPELICDQSIGILRQCLEWFPKWGHLEQELRQHGFLLDTFLERLPIPTDEHGKPFVYGNLLRLRNAIGQLPQAIIAEEWRRAYQRNRDELCNLQNHLEQIGEKATKTDVIQQMLTAVQELNVQSYAETFNILTNLFNRRERLHTRQTLLNKLANVAPEWAFAISSRQSGHEGPNLPGNLQAVWQWRQLSDELEYRATASLAELQKQMADLKNELQDLTTSLTANKAWVQLIEKITHEQQQALNNWRKNQKESQGGGIRATRRKRDVRDSMRKCQPIIPVWIMPLSRVMEFFDPQDTHFDVVIIDEASQAELTALAAIYMGDKVVIVGDEEQVSPTLIGRVTDYQVEDLKEKHLQGVPWNERYDTKSSIYDLAQVTLVNAISLQEHFRCVSPIIQFSNQLSYNEKIKPLRDDSWVQRRPFVIEHWVESSRREEESANEEKINEEEAHTIVSLIIAATEQPEYRDATFGVISMVGSSTTKQAERIDRLLLQYLGDTKYRHHQILCGNSPQFQGDERDVIFLSLVDSPSSDGKRLKLRTVEADNGRWKKRYNVAASRARDQMWVVHSLNPNTHLQNNDIRRRLILYAQRPDIVTSQSADQSKMVAIAFEQSVRQRLADEGYQVKNPWWVGTYRIALVVEGNGNRLAIACDGDLWPPPSPKQLREEIDRQATLENLGWSFTRIRASQYFRDPEEAMSSVFSILQAQGISPESPENKEYIQDHNEGDLLQRVTNRAKELRQQWTKLSKKDHR